jgi:hypothetical protein
MNWVRRFWGWFTLADAPRMHPVAGYCDFCPQPSVVLVSVNGRMFWTCVDHMNRPVREMKDGADQSVPSAIAGRDSLRKEAYLRQQDNP